MKPPLVRKLNFEPPTPSSRYVRDDNRTLSAGAFGLPLNDSFAGEGGIDGLFQR
jgi:hypothetical protein